MRGRDTGRLCYHCINKSPIGTISSLISAIKLSIVHHRPKSHLSNRQLWQVHLGTEPFDPFSCKPFKSRERWHDGSTFEAQMWNGWTTACCWICLDCAYISIQPTRERRSNCQTSTGKSHQTRAPLPASDILRIEEELLDFYGIGVVWFKVEGETLQDQARCDDFCIGGVKRTATVTWSCLTAKSQICKNVQTIVTKVTDSGGFDLLCKLIAN